MKTKIINGWTLLDDERDDGYVRWAHNGNWQNGMLYHAMSWCVKFETAIDLGSCYGAASLILAKNFKHVHAVEMYAPIMECAKINTKEHSNITFHNVAITDFNGKISINSSLYGGRNTLLPTTIAVKKQLLVPREEEKKVVLARKFDFWVEENNIENIDLIKCDIEHAEKWFIEHGQETFKHKKPVLVIEMMLQEEQKEYIPWVESIGYTLVERTKNDFIFAHPNKIVIEAKGRRVLYGK